VCVCVCVCVCQLVVALALEKPLSAKQEPAHDDLDSEDAADAALENHSSDEDGVDLTQVPPPAGRRFTWRVPLADLEDHPYSPLLTPTARKASACMSTIMYDASGLSHWPASRQ
jgi:hypothetical protein